MSPNEMGVYTGPPPPGPPERCPTCGEPYLRRLRSDEVRCACPGIRLFEEIEAEALKRTGKAD
jgi:hypothetical protein